ncbi:helix-turn-helix transcriptional regulator [Phreatobacter stygius]|uniref:Helix-turn-helix transcriptional regulator n=2 Tax=Phreatobacter stygius TaxID=1940610 RepID=A0A4D7B761_9HYPH|nr:helix-turn-helix domain-containing protein [Phreatobacter stygius]QCI69124.1 helix-turn-helix transcriptional regulator [Phreatobacter stygius]
MILLPEQCRAARALLDWSQERLAGLADVSRSTIRGFEGGHHDLHAATEAQIVQAFQAAGICLLPDGEDGLGVRLKRSKPS